MAAVELVGRESADNDWMNAGACRGLTHLFFPTSAERPQARERREATARQVCGSCTVQAPCQTYARRNHEYGFWGGESEDERHAAGFRLIAPIGVRARAS
ncbi:MAG: WhiB family transcriptional regulator [Acidimicrobiia bacterium]|nr:WhiB family transcriptional regulator [Acidimicrobiia bacterium]